jgi:arsenate reductase
MEIYHNPRCSKSRQALNLLQEKGENVTVRLYLESPPTKEELETIIKKLGISAEELLRKGETDFKEHYKGKVLTEAACIDAMLKFPKLIERPIVIVGNKAVIGRPPEKVLELI